MSTYRTELARAVWRASSYSAASGNCVEVAHLHSGHRAVRDSKDPNGPALRFTPFEWAAFTAGVRDREFDWPVIANGPCSLEWEPFVCMTLNNNTRVHTPCPPLRATRAVRHGIATRAVRGAPCSAD